MADGKVIIDTELDTKNAEKSADQFGNKLKGGLLKGAKATATAVTAVGTTAIATGGALVKMATKTAEAGDHIDKMSQKIGMSAEAYQKWDYVAKISGTSIDSLKMGFKTLTNTVDSANKGNEKAIAKFQQLGISVDDLKGKSREQIFENTIKGLQNVTDETERSALANQLLGRAGMELGPMLNSTNKDIDKLMKTAEDYGMIMSDKAVKASAKFEDSLTTMQGTFQGLKNRMSAEFLPALTEVTDGLSLIFKGDIEKGTEKIQTGITEITDKLIEGLPKFLEIGGSIIGAIGKSIMDNLPQLADTASTLLGNLVTAITEALPILTAKIPDILQTIFDAVLTNGPLILDAVIRTLEVVASGISNNTAKIIGGITTLLLNASEWLKNNISRVVEMGMTIINGLLTGLLDGIPVLLEALPQIFQNIAQAVVNSLPALAEGVSELLGNLVAKLPDLIQKLYDAVPEVVTGLYNTLTDEENLNKLAKAGKKFLGKIADGIGSITEGIKADIDVAMSRLSEVLVELGHGDFVGAGSKLLDAIGDGLTSKSAIKSLALKLFNTLADVAGSAIGGPIGLTVSRKIRELAGIRDTGDTENVYKDRNYKKAKKSATSGKGLITSNRKLSAQLNQSASVQISNTDAITQAVEAGMSGISVSIDGREFGRVVKSLN